MATTGELQVVIRKNPIQIMYNTNPISWMLWAGCLVIGLLCFRTRKFATASLQWANPRIAFGFAFLLFHVLRPLYLLLTGDFYGTRLGLYGFGRPEDMNPMLLASLLGGVSFLLGWRRGMRRVGLMPTPLKAEPGERATPQQQVASLAGRAFLLLPVVGLAFAMGRNGVVSPEAINLYYFLRSALIAVTYLLLVGGIYSQNRGLFMLAAIAALGYLWLFSRETGTFALVSIDVLNARLDPPCLPSTTQSHRSDFSIGCAFYVHIHVP